MASEHVVGVRDNIIYSLWPRVAATRTAIKHIDSHKKKGYPCCLSDDMQWPQLADIGENAWKRAWTCAMTLKLRLHCARQGCHVRLGTRRQEYTVCCISNYLVLG
jgi:hypothetical protein